MFLVRWLGPALITCLALAVAAIMWAVSRRGRFADHEVAHWSERAAQIAEAEWAVWLTAGLALAVAPATARVNGQFSAVPDWLIVLAYVSIVVGTTFALLRRGKRQLSTVAEPSLSVGQRLVEAVPQAAQVGAISALLLAPNLWGERSTALLLVAGTVAVSQSDRLQELLWKLTAMVVEPPAAWTARGDLTNVEVTEIKSDRAWVRRGVAGSVHVSSQARTQLPADELAAFVAGTATIPAPNRAGRFLDVFRSLTAFAFIGFVTTRQIPAWILLVGLISFFAVLVIAAKSPRRDDDPIRDPGLYVAALEKLYEANYQSPEPPWLVSRKSLHDRALMIGAEPSFDRPRKPTSGRALVGFCAVAIFLLLGGGILPATAQDLSNPELGAAISIAIHEDTHLQAAYELAATTAQTGAVFSESDVRAYSDADRVHAAYGLIVEVSDGCAARVRLDRRDRIRFCE